MRNSVFEMIIREIFFSKFSILHNNWVDTRLRIVITKKMFTLFCRQTMSGNSKSSQRSLVTKDFLPVRNKRVTDRPKFIESIFFFNVDDKLLG